MPKGLKWQSFKMGAAPFILREGVILLDVEDGSSRLLDLGSRFYGLSPVAARMVRAMIEGEPEAAAGQLAKEYGVSPERVRGDLISLLTDLERRHLICRRGSRRTAARAAKYLDSASIVPMLWLARLIPGSPGKARFLLVLAWASCRLLGWLRTVEVWRTGCSLRAMQTSDQGAVMRTIDAVVRRAATSLPLPAECKERALATWGLARISGVPAELVVGVHPFPLEGHCWCAYNDAIYSDIPERCAQFRPVWQCS